jgi:hypothetical protein
VLSSERRYHLGGIKPSRRVECENVWGERGDSAPPGFTRQILSLNPAPDCKADQGMHSADSAKVLENPQPRSNETPDATRLKRKGAINSMAFDFDPTDLPQWLRWPALPSVPLCPGLPGSPLSRGVRAENVQPRRRAYALSSGKGLARGRGCRLHLQRRFLMPPPVAVRSQQGPGRYRTCAPACKAARRLIVGSRPRKAYGV